MFEYYYMWDLQILWTPYFTWIKITVIKKQNKTMQVGVAEKLTLNVDFAMDLDYEIIPDDFEYDMPEYEKFESGSDNGKPNVEMGDLVAYQFINAPLNPESVKDKSEVYNEEDGLTYADWENRWNQLLDQMSFEEQCNPLKTIECFSIVPSMNAISIACLIALSTLVAVVLNFSAISG